MKNGITPEDLSQSYKDGFDEGFKGAAPAITKTLYAGIILAAHKTLGFGRERCKRLITAVDWEVLNSLSSDEAINEVYKQIGLHLDFNDPIEPISEVD